MPQLSQAELTALNAGKPITLTPPAAASTGGGTGTVTPPAPPAGGSGTAALGTAGLPASQIFANGKFNWGGNWNANFAENLSGFLNGTPVASETSTGAYPIVIWYAPLVGPPMGGINAPSFDSTGCSEMVIKVKPASPADQLSVGVATYTVSASGTVTGDQLVPPATVGTLAGENGIALTANYASAPDANGVITYTLPFSLWNGFPQKVYKVLLQDHSVSGAGSVVDIQEWIFQ